MNVQRAAVLAGLGIGLLSGAANSEELRFQYQWGPVTLDFGLQNHQAPSQIIGSSIEYDGVQTRIGADIVSVDYTFSPSDPSQPNFVANFGGNQYDLIAGSGPQFYSGKLNSPSFLPGSYTFQEFDPVTDEPDGATNTLIISIVPLPASAPLFGAGLIALGSIGYVARRKQAPTTNSSGLG